MKGLFIFFLGVALVSAFSIRDPVSNKYIQVARDDDLDMPMSNQAPPMLEITIGYPTPTHTLKTCWVRVMFVKFCTFVIPGEETFGQVEDTSNEEEVNGF